MHKETSYYKRFKVLLLSDFLILSTLIFVGFVSKQDLKINQHLFQIKSYDSLHGPGPNYWNKKAVRSKPGKVSLSIRKEKHTLTCSEIKSVNDFETGMYVFQTSIDFQQLSKDQVLGVFLYENKDTSNRKEVDVEISKWGKNELQLVYTVHSKKREVYQEVIKYNPSQSKYTHVIAVSDKGVGFDSYEGHLSLNEIDFKNLNFQYKNTEFASTQFKVHFNNWIYKGESTDQCFSKLNIHSFEFLPYQ